MASALALRHSPLLSDELATKYGIRDHTRIAAQIIAGIGFLGAGAIMRERGGIIGCVQQQ
jgi:uncharacterized membrane protein YhiD involved in acid resistance